MPIHVDTVLPIRPRTALRAGPLLVAAALALTACGAPAAAPPAHTSANFTQSFALTHPSQPNYLDLFSGSTQGITDDSCPHTFAKPNMAADLSAAGHTFAGYVDSLPSSGATVCTSGTYARKHAPWVNFSNPINHFSVLRTLEDSYGLPHDGAAASATPITNSWIYDGS